MLLPKNSSQHLLISENGKGRNRIILAFMRFLGGNSKEIDLLVQQTNQQIKVPFDKLSANDKAVFASKLR